MSINIEALEQLRRVVLAAPEERFYMGSFEGRSDCGTTRCAAGWAALDPWHQAHTRINEMLPVSANSDRLLIGMLTNVSIKGLAEVYGLDPGDVRLLFFPDTDLPRGKVVASIDSIIRGDGAIDYDDEEGGAA